MNFATIATHFRNHKTYGGFEIADKSLFNLGCRASFVVAVPIGMFYNRSVSFLKPNCFPNKLPFGIFYF